MNFLLNRLSVTMLIAVISFSSCTKEDASQISKSNLIDGKVDSLLLIMTLEEKIGQLNQYSVGSHITGPGEKEGTNKIRYDRLISGQVGSVLNVVGAEETRRVQEQVVNNSRLGIPLLFSFDVIHGYRTIMPVPLAESASWDLEAIELSARIAANEASAAGLHWTFAPMVDIARDPRWGRVMEGAGEDTYLGSQIAIARVRGFQGENLNDVNTIAACAKHFAGYGFVEGGRDYNNVYVGKHELLNTILPPFKSASDAGVATFMNAFNDIDGVPASANSYILRDLLKGDWGFKGVVVSDWNSIGEQIAHGTAVDKKEASLKAILAGTDMDMEADAYINHLQELVTEGLVDESIINDAVKRVLKLKFELGLFEDPYKYSDVEREKAETLSDENLAFSRKMAQKSIVLLKNEKATLPIKNHKSIALIGPLAKDKDAPLGSWRGTGIKNSAVSVYEGLLAALPTDVKLNYAKGCELSIGPNNFHQELIIEKEDRSKFEEAKRLAKSSELVIMVLGEPAYMAGEGRSRADIGLPGLQLELLQEVYKVNKNIVLVLINGRPLTIPWEAENIPAILETWQLGSEAGNAIADVLTGKYNPSGKLPISFPKTVGQIPVYYNHKNTGRPFAEPGKVFYSHYTDIDNGPLYPFGFGLSYSTFLYTNLKISSKKISKKDTLTISINVANTSAIDGEEVIQLYIQDITGSITRPVKELKGFKKEYFKAGESKTVSFEITEADLSFYRKDLTFGSEEGKFNVYVGSSSDDTIQAKFELIK